MKNLFKSIRLKLFFRMCIIILIILLFLIVVNNAVLETYFYYKKTNTVLDIIEQISSLEEYSDKELNKKFDYICLANDFDIILSKNENIIYMSAENFINSFQKIDEIKYEVKYNIFNKSNILYSKENTTVRKISASDNGLDFILAISKIKNDETVYIRIPISIINESLRISNEFLIIIGIISMIGAGLYSFIIANTFTKPIVDLREMTTKMKKLDFSDKYIGNAKDDEINDLGKNINDLSEKLEETINKLKKNNMELERDIEEKSKIDEMRKQFISDVSHELKTPIALIQGYAEGLIENVNKDEEDKNFYAKVILDESNKMDKLVKRLLELMKLENEEINFNDNNFDIVELIKSVITNSKVMTDEQNIEVIFKEENPIYVFADEFYIEQVVSNYYTNAIKNIAKINGIKQIKIDIEKAKENGKIRVKVFNTGKNIEEENLNRIWTRFYKVDKSRTRLKGGTGIGLALVKAIMVKYQNDYGVINKENGVEFYFELNYSIISHQM